MVQNAAKGGVPGQQVPACGDPPTGDGAGVGLGDSDGVPWLSRTRRTSPVIVTSARSVNSAPGKCVGEGVGVGGLGDDEDEPDRPGHPEHRRAH
jgi:hypothetical protein